MKVILLEDVKGVGKKGQIINASDGHARNFLFPKKMAVEATKDEIAKLDAKNKSAEHKKQVEIENALNLKKELENKVIKIEVKKGESGKLFGSVTNKEISDALSAQEGLNIDKKKIVVTEPIKSVGQKQVDVKLYAEITAKITVEIV